VVLQALTGGFRAFGLARPLWLRDTRLWARGPTMTDSQKETNAQVGRYLAQTHMFRAMIELLSEALDKPVSEIRRKLKAKVDSETAIYRLALMDDPERRAAMTKMSMTFDAVFNDYPAETKQ
jgi:hypothetical protein